MPRLLVIKMSSLGDLFHALPAVHLLKTAYGAEIDWVAQPEYAPIVRCFTDVSRIIRFPRRDFHRQARTFWRELRQARYDWIIDLQGLMKSAMVGLMARGTRRLGPSFCREGTQLLYGAVAGPRNRNRHAVEEILDCVRYLGLADQPRAFPVCIPVQETPAAHPRVALIPVSRWTSKNWPAMHFVAAGRELQRQTGAALFIFGGSATAEVDACRRLADALAPAAVNLAGRTSLLEMGSWLHAMDLVIANDSGPMHMAAALGIPVLALFGPTDARRTGPYGPRHRVLNAGTECAPCFQRACRLAGDSCMTRIHPVAVVEAAVQMLRASR